MTPGERSAASERWWQTRHVNGIPLDQHVARTVITHLTKEANDE